MKKVGIEEQNMPPVSNTVKYHPLSVSNNATAPDPAAARCVAETSQSAAMCAKDISLPTRAKTSLLHCGEVSVPD